MEAIIDGTPLPPHSITVTSNHTNETTTLAFQAHDSDLPPSQLYNVVIEAENRLVEPIQLDRVKWAHAYRVIIVPFACFVHTYICYMLWLANLAN